MIRVATVGFDNAQGFALREALSGNDVAWARYTPADAVWSDPVALAAALGEVDVVVCSSHAPRVMAALREVLPAVACAFVPVPPMEDGVAGLVRLGDFDAGRADLVAHAAGDLARAGVPVPPTLHDVLAASARLGHVVGAAAGALQAVCRVQQCFHELSAENVRLALELVAAVQAAEPMPDRLPRRYPDHGFWTPEGVTTARPDLPGEGPAVVIACSRAHVVSGNDAYLRELWTQCVDAGTRPLGWFGSTDHVTADLGPLLPELGAWISATGFTLTGHHGNPQVHEGVEVLRAAGVPGLGCLVNTTQTMADWLASRAGVGTTTLAMQIAVPELQGLVAPLVLACRDADTDALLPVPHQPRKIARLAARWAELRRTPPEGRRLAIVLIAHDPDKGKIGSASQLDVWRSLWVYLGALRDAGWDVKVPDSPEELLAAVLEPTDGDAPATQARVAERYPVRDYVREYGFLDRVLAGRGAAPGEYDNDGIDLFLHGAHFGNVFVCCQPSFGYGSDPATLLFNEQASPTHAFAAFYTWLARHLDPHLVLHFGTHGALEFMPGKQAGQEHRDFSDHLIADVPHLYLYVTSNPSEAMIAKRRSDATICSYLSPPLAQAGLYDDLAALRDKVQQFRGSAAREREGRLAELREEATRLGLDGDVDPTLADTNLDAWLDALFTVVDEVSATLITIGLHVLGEGIDDARPIMAAAAELGRGELDLPALLDDPRLEPLLEAVEAAEPAPEGMADWYSYLADLQRDLASNEEVERFVAASAGDYVEPAPGGDPIRQRDILPTGRNTFSVNPQHVPGSRAVKAGRRQAEELLAAATAAEGRVPESVSLVMWGVDTIKTMGEAAAQFFALVGVEPRADRAGRVTQLRVIPLEELGRPRIDCVVTTSGVFRDLFTCVMELMDQAARTVATLDERDEVNFLAKHAREAAARLGTSVGDAATRVFSNQLGNYGSGVNRVVDAGAWDSDGDLGSTYLRRQSFAYGAGGNGRPALELMTEALSRVEVSFQNIDGAEQSIADNDHYFEYLGGLAAAVKVAGGRRPKVYVADHYSARGRVRGIEEAMRLESRTRLLNPTWYEGMLAHGFQGVSEIGHRLDNTYGWAATVDAVEDWIFSAAAGTYLFDDAMRDRLAALNPRATQHMAERLAEAVERGLWDATDEERAKLDVTLDHLDDVVEGLA